MSPLLQRSLDDILKTFKNFSINRQYVVPMSPFLLQRSLDDILKTFKNFSINRQSKTNTI